METYTRGFSYMPEVRDEPPLQYIEGSELERTWRSSRRERAKRREQKIWEDFVREQDAVKELCKDDPYQFLDELPHEYLQELMEEQLKKMQKEEEMEQAQSAQPEFQLTVEEKEDVEVDKPAQEEGRDCDMFHIFDDENDDNDVSGPEDETLNESLDAPCTVRENTEDLPRPVSSPSNTSSELGRGHNMMPQSDDVNAGKCDRQAKSENVNGVIESSIYCAKVKDLRLKINECLMSIIESTQNKLLIDVERSELAKTRKRAAEFCARFTRIHVYQLQRQLQDLKRHSSQSLPFAKHTQFQSQMVRVVSLHQNILQAFQVFHKSLDQTWFLGDSVEALLGLSQRLQEASALGAAVARPRDLDGASCLYDDNTLETCASFEAALHEYGARAAEAVAAADSGHCGPKSSRSNPSKDQVSGRRKPSSNFGKLSCKSNTESKLSMYALDAKSSIRNNFYTKQSGPKENYQPSSSSHHNKRYSVVAPGTNKSSTFTVARSISSPKSNRSRRPLMRDPSEGQPRPARARDQEIRTLVETVGACKSGLLSEESSPKRIDNFKSPRSNPSKDSTPRRAPAPRSARPAPSPRYRNVHSPVGRGVRGTKTNSSNVKGISSARKEGPMRSPTKIVKPDYIPEESNSLTLDPEQNQALLGTIRVHTKQRTPREQPLAEEKPKESQESEVMDCEVSRILKNLCGESSGSKVDQVSGAKNAQLICVSGGVSRQASTPQLLRILEETIQKKSPRQLLSQKPLTEKQKERLRLALNIPETTAQGLFQYRTKFLQHMLASPMYANSAVGKPWEVIGRVSDKIIDNLLLKCVKEMELDDVISTIYDKETC